MKHLSFWLTLAAALGAVGILGGMTASAEETETPAAVPVATAAGGTWSVTENGSRCYYDAQGELATGEAEIDGISYLFDYSGAEKTGWRTVNGVRQYYDPETGALCSGWIEFGGNRYYTDPEQGKLTGEQWIGGSRYLLDETLGFQQTGRCTFSDGTVTYFLPDGRQTAVIPIISAPKQRRRSPVCSRSTAACTISQRTAGSCAARASSWTVSPIRRQQTAGSPQSIPPSQDRHRRPRRKWPPTSDLSIPTWRRAFWT